VRPQQVGRDALRRVVEQLVDRADRLQQALLLRLVEPGEECADLVARTRVERRERAFAGGAQPQLDVAGVLLRAFAADQAPLAQAAQQPAQVARARARSPSCARSARTPTARGSRSG
jgi:hypothetical protein